jgi:hypothetical protein
MSFLINPYVFVAAAAYDPDAADYISRVETADGQALESSVKDLINDLFVGVKDDGNFAALKACCILSAARTIPGALTPLLSSMPAPTLEGSVAGWTYDRINGLKGSGSSGGANNYLRTNYLAASATRDNNHIAAWKTTSLAGGATAYYLGYVSPRALAVGNGGNYNHGGLANPSGLLGAAIGLHGVARQSSANFDIKRPDVALTNVANATSGAPSDTEVYVFNLNNNNNPGTQWCSEPLAFYSAGDFLDLALLDARVSTFMSSLAALSL